MSDRAPPDRRAAPTTQLWLRPGCRTTPKSSLGLLDEHDACHLIVSGCAAGYHGYPRSTGNRSTGDMDIWVEATPKNAGRLVNILEEFGGVFLSWSQACSGIPIREAIGASSPSRSSNQCATADGL